MALNFYCLAPFKISCAENSVLMLKTLPAWFRHLGLPDLQSVSGRLRGSAGFSLPVPQVRCCLLAEVGVGLPSFTSLPPCLLSNIWKQLFYLCRLVFQQLHLLVSPVPVTSSWPAVEVRGQTQMFSGSKEWRKEKKRSGCEAIENSRECDKLKHRWSCLKRADAPGWKYQSMVARSSAF